MGCDIHLYTERLLEDGRWWCVDHWRLNEFYGEPDITKYTIIPLYDGRDYDLFAALADVRNYHGIDCIEEPRGLPSDVSAVVREESEYWGDDGHSHSWFLASELFKFAKLRGSYKVSGMVSPQSALLLDNEGIEPTMYCEYTTKPDWVRREWTVGKSPLESLNKCIRERMREEFWIFGDLEEGIERYKDKFRIVFWFDN